MRTVSGAKWVRSARWGDGIPCWREWTLMGMSQEHSDTSRLSVLEILATIMVAIVMGMTLAHALELPGKSRLTREQYFVVQAIYYPGFTIAGAAEPLAVLLLVALTVLVPTQRGVQFALIATALIAIILVHVIFWTMTQPVNRYWLETTETSAVAQKFFGATRPGQSRPDWTHLRDRWERSHLLRAIAATIALASLVTALVVGHP